MSSNRKNMIDPSTEVAEPQLLFEENAFPPSSTIAKDNDSKRINNLIEAIHVDILKKEEQQPQKSDRKSTSVVAENEIQFLPNETTNSISLEQSFRRTVTFDDDKTVPSISHRFTRISHGNYQLSNRDSSPDDQHENESINPSYSSDIAVDSGQINLFTQDLLSEDEYIPGGFANLDDELEEEFLNDFDDEFDDQTTRRNRYISSIRSSDHIVDLIRSPIELWQRARILIAVHLYKIQNKLLHSHGTTFSSPMITDPSIMKSMEDKTPSNGIDKIDYLEKLFEQKDNTEDRKITFGLSIIQQLPLNSSQQYQCVDFYDVGQGYIIICNIVDSDRSKVNTNDYSYARQYQSHNQFNNEKYKTLQPIFNSQIDSSLIQSTKLLVYPLTKKSLDNIQSIEWNCPFQFNFMLCIPTFRIILGFINIKNQKSLMILIGDASRKCVFLSKQEISDHVHSILYIPETSMLFIGCIGRVLLYNTQPFQITSQPIFVSELNQLPFQSNEPIIHLCQVVTHRTIGILSHRYFVLWQYAPNENFLMKFCNPHRYDFSRCHYSSKFDYIIFAFIDGFMLIYQINPMKQIRRYESHWKMITDLKLSQNQTFLLSSSIDHRINVWNLETLQHLYQYNTHEELFQIDVMHENLFSYRTLKEICFFKLNLPTLLFSITKMNVKSLKLFTDLQRIARIIAILEDFSSILISPVSGCCLTYVPNISTKPIKQVLHDISRSNIYSLQFDGEIILYHAQNHPCVAEYKIRTKSEQTAITCMTCINPMRTHLFDINAMQTSTEKSLEKQAIFFGHANGYITLFQGDLLIMEPILAHKTSIVCLETSRASMETSNISFTTCEVLLSCSMDRLIYLWDLILNKSNESIELIHLLTIEQEKNISLQSMKFLSMIDNFIVANYSDQKYLHIWQLLNISIRTNVHDQWGIVEHPTKGNHHYGEIQAISATPKLKLFASSDTEGSIKIWDNTNSLLREIVLDKSLCAIEFLSQHGELIVAYQKNIHLILPENYLFNYTKFKINQQIIIDSIAEDNRLEVIQPFIVSYQSLPLFEYNIKIHHVKKRLQRFERQLAGRFAVVESDDSQSDNENSPSPTTDRLSTISDDPTWFGLAEDVKDILRMKKYQLRQENK